MIGRRASVLLALVEHLVEKHGGTIEARDSGLGHGSEFVVRLPVAEVPGRSAWKPAAKETSGAGSTPAASGRILVVDDDRDAARSLAMLLGFAGYETHTVFDGMKAIEAVPRIRPQAVVLDIGMPNMDGCEVCRSNRQEPLGEGTVIIAVSGWGHEEARERAKEAGFNGHLVKPVEFADLRKLLSEILPSGD